ncbi:MAG: FGGY-family carbohydrate kinase [Candidatus Acidiferrales bacterium]
MSLLAIDLGSSQCKAVVFRANGDVIARSTQSYAADFPRPAHAEIDPEKFWQAACGASRAVTREAGRDPVQAVCLSSHGETFIPVDREGVALAPAILNMDNRAASQAAWCEQTLGRKKLFETTGLIVHPTYPVPKILWLREHQPDVYAATNRFLSVADYVLRRLGLPPYVDYSLASRFLAFDVQRQKWSQEILDAVNLGAERLPIPVPAGTLAGKLSEDAARNLGVAGGTEVVVGGHDQACGALGLGVIEKGRVSDSMGTYECVLAASDAPSLGDEALAACLNSYCHVVPGQFVTLAYFPSGMMVKWFAELLFGADNGAYDRLESECPAGATGLCIAPHLIGTCNPDFNPRARGIIFGLRPNTNRGDIYKAILEGLACELAQVAGSIAAAAGNFNDIYVTGGGSRSEVGLRVRAALTGRRLHVMQCQESVCLGAAILAGVACGVYSSVADAVSQLVREKCVVEPDSALAAAYTRQKMQYRLLYSALAPVRDFVAGTS